MKTISAAELKEKAKQLRKTAVTMIYEAQSGHPGGSLSIADIVADLYFREMNVDPKNPRWEDRDRFVLSKGHVCPIQYSALGILGFFPEEDLHTLRKEGSKLQGHPSMNKCPGIDISTGSLGQVREMEKITWYMLSLVTARQMKDRSGKQLWLHTDIIWITW